MWLFRGGLLWTLLTTFPILLSRNDADFLNNFWQLSSALQDSLPDICQAVFLFNISFQPQLCSPIHCCSWQDFHIQSKNQISIIWYLSRPTSGFLSSLREVPKMDELQRIFENSSNFATEGFPKSHSIDGCDDVEPCRLPSELSLPRETWPTTSILVLLYSHLFVYIVILILLIIIMMMMMTKGGSGLRERLFLTLLGDSAVPSLSCTMFSLQCTPMSSFNYDDDWGWLLWWLLPLTDTETEAGCGGVSWKSWARAAILILLTSHQQYCTNIGAILLVCWPATRKQNENDTWEELGCSEERTLAPRGVSDEERAGWEEKMLTSHKSPGCF